MTFKLVLAAIIVIGSIFLTLWKRYGTTEAKVNEWLEEIPELRDAENKALTAGDYTKHNRLVKRRMRLGKRVSRYTEKQNRLFGS